MGHYVNFKEELQQRTDYAEEVIRRWLPEERGFSSSLTSDQTEHDELQHVCRRQETEADPSSGDSSIIWRG